MTGPSAAPAPRDWNAEVYDRVSDNQREWGLEVLARLPLAGHERVLDAGCGSGRVTKALAERLPDGCVIAVDASSAMVEKARHALPSRCEVRVADLSELALEEPVDAILSTAVFHWVPDHARLFARLHDALRPGGRLAAQCGGEGNVRSLAAALREVREEEPFRASLSRWEGPWNFRAADDAAADLEAAGFTDVSCWLEDRHVTPTDPRDYLETVTLGPHLARLPEELRDRFVDAVLDRMPEPLTLDYVRLNLDARRP